MALLLIILVALKEEVKSRVNPALMSWREPPDLDFHPDAPVNWQRALISRGDKFWRVLGDFSFVVFGFVLVDAVRAAYIHQPWGDIPNLIDALLLITVLPPLFWLARRNRVDGLTQGYLNGYIDGYHKAYVDAKVEDGRIKEAEE